MRLAPDRAAGTRTRQLGHCLATLDEARQTIHEAQTRKMDNFVFHNVLYVIAFLGLDSAAMAEQEQWFAGNPDYRTLDWR